MKPSTVKKARLCLNSSAKVPDSLRSRVDFEAVSFSERRSQRAITAVIAPITKGIRQPQARSSPSLSNCCRITTTSTASNCPPIRVTYWNEAKKPRWPLSATSLM